MPRNLKGGQVEGDCVPLTWQRPSGVVSRREASLLGYNVYSVQPDKTEWTIAHEDTLVKREGHLGKDKEMHYTWFKKGPERRISHIIGLYHF